MRRTYVFLALSLLLFSVSPRPVEAEFSTVLNLPPGTAPLSIGSDTQLNVFDGGRIDKYFHSGALEGTSENIEVNIAGGYVGRSFRASGGSLVNISGGTVDRGFRAHDRSKVNISGGIVRDVFHAFEGSEVTISGGSVGASFRAFEGSNVTITGGTVDWGFYAEDGSTVRIDDGQIGNQFTAERGSIINISGGTFGDRFSANGTVNISGGSLDGRFNAIRGTVNISGGSVATIRGIEFQASRGSVVNISGGTVGGPFTGFHVRDGSEANITGGVVNGVLLAHEDSTVTISGGTVAELFALEGSVSTMIGGSLNRLCAWHGIVNIAGGSLDGVIEARIGSQVNLFGSQFILDGIDITDSLTRGEPFTMASRDVTLSGLLNDGSPFSIDMNSRRAGYEDDFIDPSSQLTLTLMSVPEPSTTAIFLSCLSMIAFAARQKRIGRSLDF